MGRVPYLFTGEEHPWARYRTCSPERSVPGQGTVPVHRRGVSLGRVPYLFTREEGGHSLTVKSTQR